MFQFPTFASLSRYYNFIIAGFPIRTSTDQRSFAPPRSFSQLTTSFVASKSLGILHTPLFASSSYTLFESLLFYSPALSMNFLLTIIPLPL